MSTIIVLAFVNCGFMLFVFFIHDYTFSRNLIPYECKGIIKLSWLQWIHVSESVYFFFLSGPICQASAGVSVLFKPCWSKCQFRWFPHQWRTCSKGEKVRQMFLLCTLIIHTVNIDLCIPSKLFFLGLLPYPRQSSQRSVCWARRFWATENHKPTSDITCTHPSHQPTTRESADILIPPSRAASLRAHAHEHLGHLRTRCHLCNDTPSRCAPFYFSLRQSVI